MTASWRAIHVDEPLLAFGHDQTADHPKDGPARASSSD
jgi:hypothetical protein